jgi:hypothetical protein
LYDKLITLLKQQRAYWKRRSKINWIKEGDAGTRLFHAKATIRHRGNTISSLLTDQGLNVSDHDSKATLI